MAVATSSNATMTQRTTTYSRQALRDVDDALHDYQSMVDIVSSSPHLPYLPAHDKVSRR